MKLIEIESWALRILENVEKHLPVEDSAVELKTEWPTDHAKAARRLAAHANAARGQTILWLIGADDKKGEIVGVNYQELSNWFSSIQSFFDGMIAPDLQSLNISYKTKTIVALCFETLRAPYLVRNPAFGKIAGEPMEWEAPWREGTKTRSATRNELILILTALGKMPKFELLNGEVLFATVQEDANANNFGFTLEMYVVPFNEVFVTFPFHKCSAEVSAGSEIIADEFRIGMDSTMDQIERDFESRRSQHAWFHDKPITHVDVKTGNEIIKATIFEIFIRGPGRIKMVGGCRIPANKGDWSEINLKITLVEAASDARIILSYKFSKRELRNDGLIAWRFN
jgi:hypothetical protein